MLTLVGHLQGTHKLSTIVTRVLKQASKQAFSSQLTTKISTVHKRNFSTEIDRILASLSLETTPEQPKTSKKDDVDSLVTDSTNKLQQLLQNQDFSDAEKFEEDGEDWEDVYGGDEEIGQDLSIPVPPYTGRESHLEYKDRLNSFRLYADHYTLKTAPVYWFADMVVEDSAKMEMIKGTIPIKTPFKNLKYTKHYPMRVRNWVRDMRTPKGFYDHYGFWRDTGIPIPPVDPRTLVAKELKHNPDQSDLPSDLRGGYRFGIKPEEIQNYPDKLKEIMSLRYASQHERLQFRLRRVTEHYRTHWRDTGSSDVQIARLTERIRVLLSHMKTHPKDIQSQYNLNTLVWRRIRLMKYLRKRHVARYFRLLKGLGLREFPFKPERWP